MDDRIPDTSLKDETKYVAECMAEALDAIGDRLIDDNYRAWIANQAIDKAHALQQIREAKQVKGATSHTYRPSIQCYL